MTGGGGDALPPSNGGEFLLSLLQRPNFQPQTPPAPPQQSLFPTPAAPITPPQPLPPPSQQQQPQPPPPQPHQQQASLSLDPAVAAVGPSIPFTTPPQPLWASGGRDLLSTPPPWPHTLSPPQGLPPTFLGFPQGPWPSHIQANQFALAEDLQRLGLNNNSIHNFYQHRPLQLEQKQQQQQQQQQKLQFGSFDEASFNINAKLNAVKERELLGTGGRNLDGGLERNGPFDPHSNSIPANFDSGELDRARGKQQQRGGGNQRSGETRMPPPGFSNNQRGGGGAHWDSVGRGGHWDSVGRGGHWDSVSRGRALDRNVYKDKANQIALSNRNKFLRRDDERASSSDGSVDLGLARQLEHPGPPAGSKLHSVSATDIEESLVNLEAEVEESGKEDDHELEDLGEELVDSLLHDGESDGKIEKKQPNRNVREKESRSDNRGKCILSRRMRMLKRQIECRRDIDRMNVPFLAIYESLIPPEEEKAKQKQLFTLLQKLVKKEWPEAQLYLYGSCANSFGVSRSDIDVCLAMEDPGINKSEVLLKLAEILVADNLQKVQALTRARVPIVKLMDPVTGISCDICINNVLAVVNTKLLRDYAEIDVRLRQLAFVVKHWAKSRGVNETYQGTLSSYAYVLMCIHFLQQRRPAILPCLQEMDATYSVTVDDIECSYFDQVEKLRGFGSRNKEPIAQLVWAFFNYWAYCHDYANSVISVRTGSIISKQEKDWTRRIGNDRHLICIEDPFEISHDLGRVVDKFSIRVLRDEFERAAEIMQHDRNPCVTLFERYVEST